MKALATYRVVTSYNAAEGYWRGICYRNGKTLTMVKARSEAEAVKEVRRQVRLVKRELRFAQQAPSVS